MAATTAEATGGSAPGTGKAIVLLSDGTGNSAAKLAKTNVWRLYQALELDPPGSDGLPRQIACYDDGVGTSALRPLALLGGVFGVGLKSNVLDLYKFLCRNYRPGDRVYAFGFSRGAFTIRLAVGLVAQEGLVQVRTEEELDRHATDAYRAFRRCFKRTGGPVGPLRRARDALVRLKRRALGQRTYDEIPRLEVPAIELVGVWDTVAAYGMPVAELTRGIDRWVWPLSMPDYVLSPKVRAARHALALDDERDTFHPLLWDEVEERRLVAEGRTGEGRIQQVWFPGVHADVGGGYADDGLAQVPLAWMIDAARQAGLRFTPHALAHLRADRRTFGPMHDSRQGLAGYYRYQPRRIGARLERPDAESGIMQDPALLDERGNRRGLLTSVKVHESAFRRIRSGTDRYAPIVLPDEYEVVSDAGLATPARLGVADRARALRQERVWDEVWKRRITYFATVGASVLLAALPLIHELWPPAGCAGLGCESLAPAISGLGAHLPDVVPGPWDLASWTGAFARQPLLSSLLAAAVAAGLFLGTYFRRRIHDRMREVWDAALAGDEAEAAAMDAAELRASRRDPGRIHRLRTAPAYQAVFRALKWWIIPWAFGLGILWAGLSATAWFLPRLAERALGLPVATPDAGAAALWGGVMTLALAFGVELTSAFLGRKEGGGGVLPPAPTGGRDGAVPAE